MRSLPALILLLGATGLGGYYVYAGAPTLFAGFDQLVLPRLPADQAVFDTRPDGTQVAASSWVASTAAATGISETAVAGYATATVLVAKEYPNCHLTWNTLAGIGQIESGHGTHGGTTLAPNGVSKHLIIGPALDGSHGTRAIRADAAWSRWTGDPVWDHAVGPMQFISSTWATWGADAEPDGVANPHDIDDAALTASRYLCQAGGDLATPEGWTRAVKAYNHSDTYVSNVLAAANRYAGS